MKFVVNRYRIDFHIDRDDPPPVPNLCVETLPFGIPPREMRDIWTSELHALDNLLAIVHSNVQSLTLSLSPFWSGPSLELPGSRFFGFSVFDNPSHSIDHRDRPIPMNRTK